MEKEGLKHMSHIHTLTLTTSTYNNTPENAVCHGCHDTIMVSTSVYRCSKTCRTSTNASLDSTCASFFLHKTCSELPPRIQHPRHNEHLLTLCDYGTIPWVKCEVCGNSGSRGAFGYQCQTCLVSWLCLKCTMKERILNHQLHSHSLTLLPLKSMFICGVCGTKEMDDFSYLCRTCLFWIHRSCALAPKSLICKLHHHDHPLLLSDSIPERYVMRGLVCSICRHQFGKGYWIYYCADCRFFAHMKCAANATEYAYVSLLWKSLLYIYFFFFELQLYIYVSISWLIFIGLGYCSVKLLEKLNPRRMLTILNWCSSLSVVINITYTTS